MAFNSSDWTIDYVAKTVTNNDSGTGDNLASVTGNNDYVGEILDFFKWLATEFAESSQMDDPYPIQSNTPTVYKWINGWGFGSEDDPKYLMGGSIESSDGNNLWSNLYTLGTQVAGTQIYLIQAGAEVIPWWGTDNIDILVKVKDNGNFIQSVNTNGVETDGGVWLYARKFGNGYDHGFADISAGGRNPLGINTAIDKANQTPASTVSNYGVKIGFIQSNFTGGTVESGPFQFGETLTQANSGATGRFIANQNDTIFVENTTGTFNATDQLTGGTSSATYTPTATNVITTINEDLNNGNNAAPYNTVIDCNGKTMSDVYEYLKLATSYANYITIDNENGDIYRSADDGVYTDVKTAPFGTIAGGVVYGARGIWFTNYAKAEFVLIDANGTTQSPPNYQNVDVNHPSLNGCNVFVAEVSGGTPIKNQYTIDSVTSTTIVATNAINVNKTPITGSLRIGDTKYTYTSFSGSTLSGVSPDPSSEAGDFYIPLLDVQADATEEQSDNIIYSTDIDVITSVRKYGFKPYDVTTTFGPTGLTFSPILAIDPQAS